MREFNFIVDTAHALPGDATLFFSDEPVEHLPADATFLDVLVHIGVFPSKGQARKNWPSIGAKLERESPEIQDGWSDFFQVGKLRHRVTILKPSARMAAAVAIGWCAGYDPDDQAMRVTCSRYPDCRGCDLEIVTASLAAQRSGFDSVEEWYTALGEFMRSQ